MSIPVDIIINTGSDHIAGRLRIGYDSETGEGNKLVLRADGAKTGITQINIIGVTLFNRALDC